MCGIIGVASKEEAIADIYDGLIMLQHRGQDAAGVVTLDEGLHMRKENGLVADVFQDRHIKNLTGSIGLGQVQNKATYGVTFSGIQPFITNHPFGVSLVHSGNLTNYKELRDIVLYTYRRYLNSKSDSELILNILAHELTKFQTPTLSPSDIFQAVTATMPQLQGAYSVISTITNHGLLAFRDPYAIRPLIYGKRTTQKGDEYMITSESVALESLDYTIIDDIQPGEAIFIDLNNKLHTFQCVPAQDKRPCIFEFVYLARPGSMIDDISVYKTRLRMGVSLAPQIKAANLPIDTIIPIPDTSRPIAQALAEQLNIPYREGLIKNRYIGRTFIMPGNTERHKSLKQKLNPITLEFKDKNVLLVDDSIVRGNTSKRIVQIVRAAGAKNVYLASGAPPILHPDVYGVDIPSRTELIAVGKTIPEIAKEIGVDALFYQTIEDLKLSASSKSTQTNDFNTGCFDLGYPTPEVTEELLQQRELEYQARQNIAD